mmetsp:Transcript_31940/g.23084  ORF Transcript_31940/g.23084 Transcript_31940/m.23084 type:complete len:85 (+) Transcript_31940:278-532(+)
MYLNGGPGSTSMNAVYMENGPLRAEWTSTEKYSDDYKVTYNYEDSWLNIGSLLFIDQPVGTGWSYGEQAATSLAMIGEDMVYFL